jgi:hypothetical protein
MSLQQVFMIPLLAGEEYSEKVIGYSPIAYWPLWETSGGTASDESGNSRDGSYVGPPTLADALGPDGENDAPNFDGTNDCVDAYSVSLRGAFDGAEGTVSGWAKVPAAAWVDGFIRETYMFAVDVDNYTEMTIAAANNTVRFLYEAGNTLKTIIVSPFSPLVWFHWALTWSATADEVKAYLRGVQVGSTQSSLGTWAGLLGATTAVIGNDHNNPPVATPFSGHLSHVALWDQALSASEIADLASV